MSREPRKPPLLRLRRPSLMGEGLPERLRSTTVAILGIVAAAGLGMVWLVLQQGFPLVASGPIPEAALERELGRGPSVADREAVPRHETGPGRVGEEGRRPVAAAAGEAPVPATDAPAAGPTGSAPAGPGPVLVTGSTPTEGDEKRRPPSKPAAGASPPPAKAPASPTPPAPAGIEPSATSSETPAPAPESAPEPVPPPHPGNGNAYGKGNGNGLGNGGVPPGHAEDGSSGVPPGHADDGQG